MLKKNRHVIFFLMDPKRLKISEGTPTPLGLSFQGDRANFALFSSHATQVFLGLFFQNALLREIEMQATQDVWHIAIQGCSAEMEYAFRCLGPPKNLYNPKAWLSDPYGKIGGSNNRFKVAPLPPFDWQGVQSPQIPLSDLCIYEMHVRGFTQDPSSKVIHPGTYLGMIEKIPYIQSLGVNAVELMPIFECDESHCKNIHPETKKNLVNYWGYNPFHFFAPKQWYAVSDPIQEFKTLVRELHKNGIEVLLDVVYNHTGEGKEKDFYVNLRGIDNSVYYLTDPAGNYLDFTGCGNTINANHPRVQEWILASLRYWVEEMHVDGFRFDLASILTRGTNGKPMKTPPLLQAIAQDPILSRVKLIAEAWDAAGLYQLGTFPKWGHWSEWNGRYRDVVRRFIKGTDGKAGLFANVLCGSEMIYHSAQTPLCSVNFITAHDGFCLRDLVTYQQKHNFANGEGNRDGSDNNDNWNCGSEGPTHDPQISALRERQMRNFLLALFLSQGIPMLLMGDEQGHTRLGNNNPYVQDNRINWFLWDEQNPKIFTFVRALLAFRKQHPVFRHASFLKEEEVEWHTHWDETSRLVVFTLKKDPALWIAFNANYEPVSLDLPPGSWTQLVNTEEDWIFHQDEKTLQGTIELPPYSAHLLIHS